MKLLTGHQPNYLPYPGFFSKILQSDVFVIVDHVQFKKKSNHMRNKIVGPNGSFDLSIPTNSNYQSKICDVKICNSKKVLKKHWKSIELSYKKYPYFLKYYKKLKNIYEKNNLNLLNFNTSIIKYILEILEIKRNIYFSSDILKDTDLVTRLKKNEMIIEMCKKLKCDGYISGRGAIDYIDELKFKQNGLKHIFSNYKPIEYKTPKGKNIINVSIIDAIFSIGAEETRKLIYEEKI